MNEILFFATIIATFSCALFIYRCFGKWGLFAWSVFATLFANIEVCKTIQMFGFETTLGNVMFGTTFFATDVLSECYGKKLAQKCVYLTLLMTSIFVFLLQFSLAFVPSTTDFAAPHLEALFSLAPRVFLTSIFLYFFASMIDVNLYHKTWKVTGEKSPKWMWIRNNLSTMTAQAIQQTLFMFGVFYGVEGFDVPTIIEMGLTTTLVVIIVAACDTPFLYLARNIYKNQTEKGREDFISG